MPTKQPLRRWLAGVAFGSAVAGAVCLLPPHEPIERDPLLLLLVGSAAGMASGAILALLDDRGLLAVTLITVTTTTAVGLFSTILNLAAPGQGSAMRCLALCILAWTGLLPSIRRQRTRWIWALVNRPRRRGFPAREHATRLPTGPQRLGAYQIMRRLGEGGMGTVWLGRATDGTLVAIKTIRSAFAEDPQFLARFRREVDAARRVPRSCTAPVIDSDLDAATPYLVTEYVDGPTLEQAVAADGPLPPSRLGGVAAGIAAALMAIHGAGVVHRDLKPANILLPPGGVVVIDFGVARPFEATMSLSGATLGHGTPSFMAPEQFTGDPVTPAADVFAWGSVVTFAGTGRPPYRASSILGLRDQIVEGTPDLEDLDRAIRPLVEQALQKNPAERPSPNELLRQLQPR